TINATMLDTPKRPRPPRTHTLSLHDALPIYRRDDPAMSTQHPGWSRAGHIPDGNQRIRASTSELGAIGTPVDTKEGRHIAAHNAQALRTFDIPQPQSPVVTATEQAAAVGGKGQAIHLGSMSLQHCSGAPLFDIPQPNRGVTATTGQR